MYETKIKIQSTIKLHKHQPLKVTFMNLFLKKKFHLNEPQLHCKKSRLVRYKVEKEISLIQIRSVLITF